MIARRLGLAGLLICAACESDREVPFKRPSAHGSPTSGALATTTTGGATAGPHEGVSYPDGTRRLDDLAGATFEHPSASILAALGIDLDGDGDSDLILVSAPDPDGDVDPQAAPPEQPGPRADAGRPRAILEVVEHQADGWGRPESLRELGSERCALGAARLRALGPQLALVTLDLACAPEDEETAPLAASAPGPAPDVPPAPEGHSRSASTTASSPPPPAPDVPMRELQVLSLERTPRVLFRLAVEPARDGLRVVPTIESGDQDGDGHADVKLSLGIETGTADGELQPLNIEIALLDRPSGLARDSEQPEQTLLAIANEAKKARKGKPASARAAAERVLNAHRALCRESGEAVLHVNGIRGLPCGPSLAAGRAASVLSAVLASQGRLLEALALADELEDRGRYQLTDNDRERVDYAFETLRKRSPTTWRRGPPITLGAAPTVRRPALAFIDERRVLVRGRSPQSYDVDSGEFGPVGIHGDLLLRDPERRLAITDLFRSCDGYHLRIVSVSQVVAGVVTGGPVSEPLVIGQAAPPGAQCPGPMPENLERDHGGLRVLAWTRSGVLLDREGRLLLLALDEAAAARAPARELAPTDSTPELEHSIGLTIDGTRLARAVGRGILVLDRRSQQGTLRPAPEASGEPSDVALSPSGTRIALLRGGHLWIAGAPALPASGPGPRVPQVPPPAYPETDRAQPPAPPEPSGRDEG